VSVQVLAPEPLLYHAEVLRRNGRPVGYVRAASYGHTVGGAVGLAMVEGDGEPITPAWLADATWTLEINGAEHPAATSLRPLHDPTNDRIKQ
jgi:glycine cleavage system aminomethyltransferase T